MRSSWRADRPDVSTDKRPAGIERASPTSRPRVKRRRISFIHVCTNSKSCGMRRFQLFSSDARPDPIRARSSTRYTEAAPRMHILTTVDTLNSVNRFMNRKALSERDARRFPDEREHSASLIDSPVRAIGLHRAFFINNAKLSRNVPPYAIPDSECWPGCENLPVR